MHPVLLPNRPSDSYVSLASLPVHHRTHVLMARFYYSESSCSFPKCQGRHCEVLHLVGHIVLG
jgi:hypothetical protein